ncbi:hypothetical protein L0222_03455 [bacterium]|nr:hypothetical protein [bacterium]
MVKTTSNAPKDELRQDIDQRLAKANERQRIGVKLTPPYKLSQRIRQTALGLCILLFLLFALVTDPR